LAPPPGPTPICGWREGSRRKIAKKMHLALRCIFFLLAKLTSRQRNLDLRGTIARQIGCDDCLVRLYDHRLGSCCWHGVGGRLWAKDPGGCALLGDGPHALMRVLENDAHSLPHPIAIHVASMRHSSVAQQHVHGLL